MLKNRQMGTLLLCLTEPSLIPSCSWNQDKPPTWGECRNKFYNHYLEMAKEHDKEFLGKYDQDFNTTLIFVGSP